jgi:hypothetical protein
VYENVPKKMRSQLWLSLLDQQQATARSASSPDVLADDAYSLLCEDGYYSSLVAGFTSGSVETGPDHFVEDVGAVIGRDISRTFPTHPLFQTSAGRAKLQRVLHAYAIHDPGVGYCQGMAFVAGILLMNLEEEHRAFAALVMLMQAAGLRLLYLPGMVALQLRLRQLQELLRRRQPGLCGHLETHDVSPVIYASSWFLSLFAAEFPYSFTARILDVMLAERSCAVCLRVALGLLDACENALLELHDFEALVMYLKLEPKTWPHDRLREVLTLAIAMEGITDDALAVLEADIAAADAVADEEGTTTPTAEAAPYTDAADADGAGAAGALAALTGGQSPHASPPPPQSSPGDGTVTPRRGGGDVAHGAGVISPRIAAGPAHHLRNNSRAMLEMLMDMDLGARVTITSSPGSRRVSDQDVPAADDSTTGAADSTLDDWVTVAPPMSGGTLGVLASGGTLPALQAKQTDGPNARPSLRMLSKPQQRPTDGDTEDLISLS